MKQVTITADKPNVFEISTDDGRTIRLQLAASDAPESPITLQAEWVSDAQPDPDGGPPDETKQTVRMVLPFQRPTPTGLPPAPKTRFSRGPQMATGTIIRLTTPGAPDRDAVVRHINARYATIVVVGTNSHQWHVCQREINQAQVLVPAHLNLPDLFDHSYYGDLITRAFKTLRGVHPLEIPSIATALVEWRHRRGLNPFTGRGPIRVKI